MDERENDSGIMFAIVYLTFITSPMKQVPLSVAISPRMTHKGNSFFNNFLIYSYSISSPKRERFNPFREHKLLQDQADTLLRAS